MLLKNAAQTGSAPKVVVCALTFVWLGYNSFCGFATAKAVVLLQHLCGFATTNFVVYGKNERISFFTIYLFYLHFKCVAWIKAVQNSVPCPFEIFESVGIENQSADNTVLRLHIAVVNSSAVNQSK